MKKFLAIATALVIAAAFTACGANDTAEDTTAAETTASTEAAETADVIPADMAGMFEITAENNEGIDLNATFGSEFATTGGDMTIQPDGTFDFSAGTWGGTGTVTEDNGVLTATYTDIQETAQQTLTLTWNEENRTYLMNINDAAVIWSIKADSDGDVLSEDMTGIFEITAENNEGVDLNSVFGSEFAKTGAQMTIRPDGTFDFSAGTWGGTGTVTEDNGVLTATYTDNQETAQQTLTLTFNAESRTYTMNINDASVVWSIAEQ